VVVGAPASPRIYGELGQPRSEVLTVVERSFEVGACLELDYVDRREKESRRTVEPHGLLVETPAWYLLCRDRERQAVRMFRLDRIRMARLLPLTFQPDLEAVHREWLAQRAGE
jgi:predicted DNA-binding transcriptional regulator YafY